MFLLALQGLRIRVTVRLELQLVSEGGCDDFMAGRGCFFIERDSRTRA